MYVCMYVCFGDRRREKELRLHLVCDHARIYLVRDHILNSFIYLVCDPMRVFWSIPVYMYVCIVCIYVYSCGEMPCMHACMHTYVYMCMRRF
jgi:hypothetical protein